MDKPNIGDKVYVWEDFEIGHAVIETSVADVMTDISGRGANARVSQTYRVGCDLYWRSEFELDKEVNGLIEKSLQYLETDLKTMTKEMNIHLDAIEELNKATKENRELVRKIRTLRIVK
jgi:hypothetical protein